MDNNYNLDDILSEIKSRKLRERQERYAEQEEPPARPAEEPSPPQAPLEESWQAPMEDFRFDAAPEPERRRQNPMEFTGHVRPITDKARMRPSRLPHTPPGQQPPPSEFSFRPPSEQEPPAAMDRTAAHDFSSFRLPESHLTQEHTRVLPAFEREAPQDAPPYPQSPRREGEGGMAQAFTQGFEAFGQDAPPAAGQYGSGYYEEEDPLSDPSDHSAVDFSEYNSIEDRRDVATDIARVKLWLLVRGAITALLTFFLFWFSLAGRYYWLALPEALLPENPETFRAYLIACTVGTALLALVNSSTVGGGLMSLFKMRANSDTLVTLAVLAAVGQGVMGIVNPESIDPTGLALYYPIAGLAMLFGVLGKMTMINRIQTNFRLLSTDLPKKALLRVEDEAFCQKFIPDSTRKPTIAYSVRADFFTDFLGLSYSDMYDVGINRAVAPVCLAGAVVVAVVCYLLTESTLSAVSAFAAILCVAATFSATFVENIPLGKLTKKLAPAGGMVSGNKAVEDFCDTDALVLSETDLFPEGNVRLRGIKTFSQGRIDESILDAASVICALEGALSPVFLQTIGGNRNLLKKVDNIVCENGMGVSAWVNSRRVLIGNRLLMEAHGIRMPTGANQGSIGRAPEDGDLLYLSSAGEITAQFAVSYHIDEDLAGQLDLLAAQEKQLILYVSDANITPHRVWELYGYPEDLIQVIPAELHAQYHAMAAHREKAIAEIVYTGRATTFAASIVACINARSSILSATLVQLIQITLGYGLIAFMAFMGAIGSLSILQMTIYQLFWFVVIFVVQKAKQP